MGRRIASVIAALAISLSALSVSARAEPICNSAAAEVRTKRIEGFLADQARRARLWNRAWGASFAVAAAGQITLGIKPAWTPLFTTDADDQKALYVGAAKSALGAGGRVVTPLRVIEPNYEPGATSCQRLLVAQRALRLSAKRQRNAFWLNHLGGVAVNIMGALVLGLAYDDWENAAISVAVGYPVGLLSTYSMPRGAWQAVRSGGLFAGGQAPGLTVVPMLGGRARGASLSFAF